MMFKVIGGKLKRRIIDAFLSQLYLSEYQHTLIGNLSEGNKRKLQFGLSILSRPHVLLLDEPSSGMDPESKR